MTVNEVSSHIRVIVRRCNYSEIFRKLRKFSFATKVISFAGIDVTRMPSRVPRDPCARARHCVSSYGIADDRFIQ